MADKTLDGLHVKRPRSVRNAMAQRRRLTRVFGYMIESTDQLTPIGFRQDHLDQWLCLHQWQTLHGPIEARLVFGPCLSYQELPVRYVVHRLVWDRDRDLERAARRRVVYPDVTSTTFRLTGKRLERVEAFAQTLGTSMRSLKLDLVLEAEPPPEDSPTNYRVSGTPGWWRQAKLPGNPAIEMNFNSNWLGGKINDAWEDLWAALGAACRADTKIEKVRVSYDPVPLKSYARLLAEEMK